jgi:hypothetical protein
MDNVSKIVHERLKAGALEANHPEADELTAFAERSLAEVERIAVLEHLARCCDCRDILALALPATDALETAVRTPAQGWVNWPALRWGLVAAGIVAIALLGIVQYQRPSGNIAATSGASHQVVFEETRNQPLASPPPSAGVKKAEDQVASSKVTNSDRQIATMLSEKKKRVARAGGAGVALPAAATGYSAASSPLYKQQAAADPATNMRVPAVSERVAAQAQSAPLDTRTSEAGQFEPPTAPQPANHSNNENYAADRVGKAKPAVISQSAAPVAPSIIPRSIIPRWAINADGVLQRSFDDGATWQTVEVEAPRYFTDATGVDASGKPLQREVRKMASPTFRAVAVTGTDVWAGGSGAILYHSQDAGDHWTRVMPASSGATLTGDIVSLEFLDMQHGKVSTSTAEIWSTSDDGQTWQKQ